MGVRRWSGGLCAAFFLAVATAAGGAAAVTQPAAVVEPVAGPVPAPVLAAAGDIACDPKSPSFNAGSGTAKACHQQFTSDLLQDPSIPAVATLGDNAYLCGSSGSYA